MKSIFILSLALRLDFKPVVRERKTDLQESSLKETISEHRGVVNTFVNSSAVKDAEHSLNVDALADNSDRPLMKQHIDTKVHATATSRRPKQHIDLSRYRPNLNIFYSNVLNTISDEMPTKNDQNATSQSKSE